MTKELEKCQVVEAEVLDEQGRPINQKRESRCFFCAARRGLWGVVGGVFALAAGLIMFILFAAVMIIIAVPLLILSLFGKKPNIKVFKYRI